MEVKSPGSILIEKLLEESDKKGGLSSATVERISRNLGVPVSRTYAIAEALDDFVFTPLPKSSVEICIAPACELAGATESISNISESEALIKQGARIRCALGTPLWHKPALVGVKKKDKSHAYYNPDNLKPATIGKILNGKSPQKKLSGDARHRKGALHEKHYLRSFTKKDTENQILAVNHLTEAFSQRETEKRLQRSRLINSNSGVLLSGEISRLKVSGARTKIIICDISGTEPENSPGPVVAALATPAMAGGMIAASLLTGAEKGIIFYSHTDMELGTILEKLICELDFSGLKTEGGIGRYSLAKFGIPDMLPIDRGIGLAALYSGLTFSEAASRSANKEYYQWPNGSEVLIAGPEDYLKLFNLATGDSNMEAKERTGSTTVSIGGKINKPCLVEISPASTLEEILFEYGSGLSGESELKAIHVGGITGGPLPASSLESTYRSALKRTGGSLTGQILFIDQSTCMVKWAEYFSRLAERLCCGACVTGRLGPVAIQMILDRIINGESDEPDLHEMENIVETVRENSLCPQCGNLLNPIVNAFKYFERELKVHILQGECPSGKCREQKVKTGLC